MGNNLGRKLGTAPGNQQPPLPPTIDPCVEARAAALEEAELMRNVTPKNDRPSKRLGFEPRMVKGHGGTIEGETMEKLKT